MVLTLQSDVSPRETGRYTRTMYIGLNVLDVAGSIKYFSIPSINPNCTSVQNGNNLAVTFTMPPADNSAYYSQLYLVIGEDSIVSDKKYIAPTAPYIYTDSSR